MSATAGTLMVGSKRRQTALWILQILLAIAFIGSGVAKLVGAQAMVDLFAAVGVGQWFRYFTGLLEITGAGLLLAPGQAMAGGVVLTVVMIGAIVTHLTVLHTSPASPAFLLLLALFVTFARRPRSPSATANVNRSPRR